jgi:hypothetical protein
MPSAAVDVNKVAGLVSGAREQSAEVEMLDLE